MNRTFIVETYAGDDFGQWAKDEVTGEQGHVDDERSCFWTWDDTEGVWQSRPLKGRQVKRKKRQGKRKAQRETNRSGRTFLGEEQSQDSEMWSEEDFAWWTKGRKARRACQEAMMAFRRVVFALTSERKAQTRIIPRTKARESSKKEKARKKLILNRDLQLLKHPEKKNMAMPGNLMTGLPVSGLMILGLQLLDGTARLGCTRSIGSRSAIERFQKHSWYFGVTTEFCRCLESYIIYSLSNNTTRFHHG